MELRGVLRAPPGGAPERVTVLQLSDHGCLIEASRPLELGERVELELAIAGEIAAAQGLVSSSNELQLLYNIRFGDTDHSGPWLAAARELDDRAGD